MGPEALAQVLRPLTAFVPPERKADLIVSLAEGDDAAVLKLDAERALVFTVDFFTPVVNDPCDFGAVAAANALSDVCATGGEPLMALNVAAFPTDLDPAVIEAIVLFYTTAAAFKAERAAKGVPETRLVPNLREYSSAAGSPCGSGPRTRCPRTARRSGPRATPACSESSPGNWPRE